MSLILNKISQSLNAKKHSLIIFCDLQKAFDTCNHSILISKLSKLGLSGTSLLWFKNYLSNRQQFVTINSFESSLLYILTGVPQGSILGPLLFLIYINDLPLYSKLISNLFADDTALFYSSDNLTELFNFVNSEFQKLCTYFRHNKLSLHPAKTKFLLISPSLTALQPIHRLFINNNNPNENDPSKIFELAKIELNDKVPAIKYLGVFFDPCLNFKYHISQISKKLSFALYKLRQVKNLLPQSALVTLYYSLFHCHLVYAIEIWSCVPFSLLKPLLIKQKSAIRIITNKSHNAHTEPLFKSLAILPLPDLIYYFNLKFFHSYHYRHLPTAFSDSWLTTLEQRNNTGDNSLIYNLRNNDDYYISPSISPLISRLPLHNLPNLWNLLPNNLKIIPNKNQFSQSLKNYLLEKLSANFTCNRLFCPSCIQIPNNPNPT